MKVRITKGSGWYRGLEGVEIVVKKKFDGKYFVDDLDESVVRFINAEDCEIVKDDEKLTDPLELIAKLSLEVAELKREVAELKSERSHARTYDKQPPTTRDEIVEQAKRDVEYFTKYIADKGAGRVEFIVNREKRTVVALWKSRFGNVLSRAIAKCAPQDCFNSHIGRAIAVRRLLNERVPDEYLNAPQPTEVRVGDVVLGKLGFYANKIVTLTGRIPRKDFIDSKAFVYMPQETSTDYIYENQFDIIDDSREEVAVQ